MNCRKCGREMEEGLPFCPACGTDHTAPETPAEQPKKPIWKPILAGVCVLLVVVGIIAGVMLGMRPNTVQNKDNYIGSKNQVLAAADTVVATAGDLVLTNSELQIHYWNAVYDFASYYGALSMNLEKPLSEQIFDSETGKTLEQYLLETAVLSWRRYAVLAAEAKANGVALDSAVAEYIDNMYETVKAQLGTLKFDSVEAMIAHDFGPGGTFENYQEYLRDYYLGTQYYTKLFSEKKFSDQEIEAYYAKNLEALKQAGCSKEDGSVVDVRHILIAPSDEDKKEYTAEEWSTAEAEAQRILDLWLQGEKTEDSFADLAKEYSDCPSSAQGGLIEAVTKGQMVQEFEDWCMESHEYGDYDIVKTMYGYHIMFYIHGEEAWYDACTYYLASEALQKYVAGVEENYPLEINYSKIVLGEATLTSGN